MHLLHALALGGWRRARAILCPPFVVTEKGKQHGRLQTLGAVVLYRRGPRPRARLSGLLPYSKGALLAPRAGGAAGLCSGLGTSRRRELHGSSASSSTIARISLLGMSAPRTSGWLVKGLVSLLAIQLRMAARSVGERGRGQCGGWLSNGAGVSGVV